MVPSFLLIVPFFFSRRSIRIGGHDETCRFFMRDLEAVPVSHFSTLLYLAIVERKYVITMICIVFVIADWMTRADIHPAPVAEVQQSAESVRSTDLHGY